MKLQERYKFRVNSMLLRYFEQGDCEASTRKQILSDGPEYFRFMRRQSILERTDCNLVHSENDSGIFN